MCVCVCVQVLELELEFRASDPEFHSLYIMSHLPLFIDITHALFLLLFSPSFSSLEPRMYVCSFKSLFLNMKYKKYHRDFTGAPVVKTPSFHFRGWGLDPWSGN